jgi:zinc protease
MWGRVCAVALFAFIAFTSSGFAAAPGKDWPQAHSSIPADPEVTFGKLPNGMRYLIKQNSTPSHAVSFRLRFGAGSLDESDSQEGMAHLLEHMAFRGSAHLADGEMFKTLESLGAGRGRDTNAFTHPDHTVFVFDLPVNDAAALDKTLLLLRDVADGLNLDAKTLDSERAVVQAEIRQKNVATFRAWKTYIASLLGSRLGEALNPGGKAEIVQNATAAQLRDFYRSHYRPEDTVLIVVGDVERPAMAEKIKAAFSGWRAGAAAAAPAYAVNPEPGLKTTLFAQAGAADDVTLSWVFKHDASPDSLAKRRHNTLRAFALTILNHRFQDMAQAAEPPFLSASASYNTYGALADTVSLSARYTPGKLPEALRALHETVRQVLRSGIETAEMERVLANARASNQASETAAKTMPSSLWANSFTGSVGDDTVITAPDEWLWLFEQNTKDLQPAQFGDVLHELFAAEPKVFVSSSEAADGVEATVQKVFAEPEPAAEKTAAAKPLSWPYTAFGTPGKAAISKTVDDLGVTFATFPNGVRATIKPTKFLTGQIRVRVLFGGGRLGFSTRHKSPSWALGGAFMNGGLGRIAHNDISKVLAGKEVGFAFDTGDTAFEFNGETRTEDFDSELQLMAAYLSDPAWRPEAFEKARAAMASNLKQAHATANGEFGFQFWAAAHGGDIRWQPPTDEEVRATRLDAVKELLRQALKDGPVEVVVVGDIPVADALDGIGNTLGALPRRSLAKAPAVGDERQPAPQQQPIVLPFQGKGAQAIAAMAWPTTSVYPDTRRLRIQAILVNILGQRLFDELRVQDGMTYTPQTRTVASPVSPGYGFVGVHASVPKERIADFYAAVDRVIAALKTQEVTASELERARSVLLHDIEQAHENNAYWVERLDGVQIDPRRLDLIRSALPDMKNVTAAEVLKDAQTYLKDEKAWKLLIVPQDFESGDGKTH